MSIIRVSTANAFDNTVARITQRSSDLRGLQEQLSSGKRVVKASDDPVAATLAERESNRLKRAEADLRALERSRTSLELAESGMGQIDEVMFRFKELLVQGGNATLTPSDRKSLALEMRGLRDELLNLTNLRDAEGYALLGGLGVTNSQGIPFVDQMGASTDADGMSFQGVGGQSAATDVGLPHRVDGDYAIMRNLSGDGVLTINSVSGAVLAGSSVNGTLNSDVFPYDPSATAQGRYEFKVVGQAGPPQTLELQIKRYARETGDVTDLAPISLGTPDADGSIKLSSKTVSVDGLQITLNGQAADGAQFDLNPSQPTNLFATLDRAIAALENVSGSATQRTQDLARVHQEMETAQDRLSLVRGRLGEFLRRADNIEGLLKDRSVAAQKELSSLTDLDMMQGVSSFQSQQLGLQAALQSYAQIHKTSLFQYIA